MTWDTSPSQQPPSIPPAVATGTRSGEDDDAVGEVLAALLGPGSDLVAILESVT